MGPVTYEVCILTRKVNHCSCFHVNMLKKWHVRSPPSTPEVPVTPLLCLYVRTMEEEDGNNEQYLTQCSAGKRTRLGAPNIGVTATAPVVFSRTAPHGQTREDRSG